MPTPPKPVKILKLERKSHRTRSELRQREKAEEELLTGKKLKESDEVRGNELAHKEFIRIRKLLTEIGKNDDLYSGVINRYCLISAECKEFEEKREHLWNNQKELENHKKEMDPLNYFKLQNDLTKQLLSYDKQVQAKRKMLFDIEKENIMTIASALRSIPKKQSQKKSALQEALSG